MAIITILSASANAIIAGFLYQESITDYSEFSYGEMFKQAGLAFLGGLIVGGLSILATFLVFALALTALECMLCMMICGVLGILTDSISDTFFSDNEIVNQILKYVSQGLYGAGLTFGLAGIAGGGITYGGADDAAGYSPKGASKTGQGFNTFNDAKKALGSAGEGKQWHHIVEQSQIQKSGFDPTQIHNTNNLIAIDKATHAKISGYYNTKSFDFTGGMSVRDWLAGQSYQTQYDFGMNVLNKFGVIK